MISVPLNYRFMKLGTNARLVVFASFAAAGILLQLYYAGNPYPGLVVMALPLFLLMAKPWTNKPDDQGEEDWQRSGSQELDRIADAFAQSRKIKLPILYRSGGGIVFSAVLLALAFLGGGQRSLPGIIAMDAFVLFWPVFHFIKVKLWVPREFELIMHAIQAARTEPVPEGISLVPYLRLDRDKDGLRIPESARLMIEKRGMSDDLLGIQIQVTINNGPNGPVPYIYAVVITKGQTQAWRKASDFSAHGFLVEADGSGDYCTVVVRPVTSGGGYHSTPDTCRKLMKHMYNLIQTL